MASRRMVNIIDESSSDSSESDAEEDVICCVCYDGTWTDGDPIVLCDGCDMPVHKECYGYPLVKKIPDDEWLCAPCKSKREGDETKPVCALCPLGGGALKRTTEYEWVHLVCALWVPEVFFHFPDGREPIDITKIPLWRFDYTCMYCDSKHGCCITCSETGCKAKFHVSCGLEKQVLLKYKSSEDGPDTIVIYCAEHSAKLKKKKNWKKIFYTRDG